ncbi:MAG: RNA polymerase sigma factor [Gemmatimonadetes bacterium]|nr:RNA polymerase sigma factor [Gemmatimonadota bacterium]
MIRLTGHELTRFHDGDELLFRRVVESWSPRLLAAVRPFATDLDDAHDLLQEAWQRAYEKRTAYTGTGTLIGWLYAVCRNVCLTALERRKSREQRIPNAHDLALSAPRHPGDIVENAELGESINRAIMELPDRERDVVVLRLVEQRSTSETAELLGCAEGTVKAALHHAVKKLQSSMEVWVR